MSFWLGSSASSGNPSLAWSMGNGGKGRLLIKFPFALDSGWYKEQACTKFQTFQHRKERKGFKHEFIVLQLLSGSVCRVERMGDPDARFDAISPRGSVAHDMAQCFGPDELEYACLDSSDIISEIRLPCEFDIMDVLHICRAIHEGEKTRNYTLQLYNCWFFSLAIQACLIRFIAHWEHDGLFQTWLSDVQTGIVTLPDALYRRTNSASKSYRPIIFRLYSALFSTSNPSCRDPLAEEIKIRLQFRLTMGLLDIRQAIASRINDLLWHTNIESGLNKFLEDEIKAVVISTIEDSLDKIPLISIRGFDETSSRIIDDLKLRLGSVLRDVLVRSGSDECIVNVPVRSHLKSKKVHEMVFEGSFQPKAKKLNFNGKMVGPHANTMDMRDWYRWVLNYLLHLALWLLHTISSLWGVELFASGNKAILFVAVDEKLGRAVARLKGLKAIAHSDLERFIDDVRSLTRNKFANWSRNPWAEVRELILQELPVHVLEEIEKNKPTVQFYGYNLNGQFISNRMSISALQGHIRERAGIHAKEVASVWLGTAPNIKTELEDALSQVWSMIREDDIPVLEATPYPLAASHAKLAGLFSLMEHAGPAQPLAVTAAVAPHLPQFLALAKSGQLNAQQLNQLKTLVAMVAKHSGKPIPNQLQRSVQGSPQVQAANGSFPNSPVTMNATPPQPAQQSHSQTANSQSPHLGQNLVSNQSHLVHPQLHTQNPQNPPQPANHLPTPHQLHYRKALPGALTPPLNDLTQQTNNANAGQVNGVQGGQANGAQMNGGAQLNGFNLLQSNSTALQQNGQTTQPTTRQIQAAILGRAKEIARQRGYTDEQTILPIARGLMVKFQQQQLERLKAQ